MPKTEPRIYGTESQLSRSLNTKASGKVNVTSENVILTKDKQTNYKHSSGMTRSQQINMVQLTSCSKSG